MLTIKYVRTDIYPFIVKCLANIHISDICQISVKRYMSAIYPSFHHTEKTCLDTTLLPRQNRLFISAQYICLSPTNNIQVCVWAREMLCLLLCQTFVCARKSGPDKRLHLCRIKESEKLARRKNKA